MKKVWNRKFTNGKLELVLEHNPSTKIVRTENGYYLVCESDDSMSDEMNVGFLYDNDQTVINNAEKKLRELKVKERNFCLATLVNMTKQLSKMDFDAVALQKLNAGFTLPSSYIPKYIYNSFFTTEAQYALNRIYKNSDEKAIELFRKECDKILYTDPNTQSALVAGIDCTDYKRKTTVEKLVGIKAINEKGKLVFKKKGLDNKVFETFQPYNNNAPQACTGLTITVSDYGTDCTVDLIFFDGKPYIILNDRNNEFHDIILSDKSVLKNLRNDYGIDFNQYFTSNLIKEKVNEAFGDEDSPFAIDNTEEDIDGNGEETPAEEDDVEDIISEVDPEVQKEIEVIEANIQKIEDLPDDIRENESIKEIYLMLLGKKEMIQKQHDEEKSQEIVDSIIDSIKSELGEIDPVFKQDDNDSNEIKVEEGRNIDLGNGVLIKPMVSNTFGKKDQYLIVENNDKKEKFHIKDDKTIRRVVEEYISIERDNEQYYTINKAFNNADELINIILSDDELIDTIMSLPQSTIVVSSVNGKEISIKELLDVCE